MEQFFCESRNLCPKNSSFLEVEATNARKIQLKD